MVMTTSEIKTSLWRFAREINAQNDALLKDIEKFDGSERSSKRIMNDISTVLAWADMAEKNYYSLLEKKSNGTSLRGCSCKAKPKKRTRKSA